MSNKKTLELAISLNTAITRLGRRIRRIDDRQDIGRARLSALSVLVFGGPCTMAELARDEMVSPATMHHVVTALVDLGLARKQSHASDGRKTMIHATAAGRRFMDEARQARLDFYSSKLEAISDRERAAIAEFVRLSTAWLEK